MNKFTTLITTRPILFCFIAGALSALAMAPTFIWPVLIVTLTALLIAIGEAETPKQGAARCFWFGMGYFIIGLFWVANALLLKIADFWWLVGFAVFGLPFLLSILWFVAGYLAVKFTKPRTLARSVIFLTLLALAEYGRAFNLTGFPWNLFGYTWGFSLPMMQTASIGGAYLLTALTIYWMAAPYLAWLARAHRKTSICIGAVAAVSILGCYAFGAARLATNPTLMRDDFGVIIVQPNIDQSEKWAEGLALKHFLKHLELVKTARTQLTDADMPKRIALVFPETAIDDSVLLGIPEAAKSLLETMKSFPVPTQVVSGLWRQQGGDREKQTPPDFYNSIGSIGIRSDKLALMGLYDKHHLVPFGEYLPLEKYLNLTPLVGFAGFHWGPGPRVTKDGVTPPFSSMICFEAIFPWYAKGEGAEWIVNTSNDGWYGNTPGPYQHLTMTQFRAIEQGKPIARSATTGLSALIDPYGRILEKIGYEKEGVIASKMPQPTSNLTMYDSLGETLFFLLLAVSFVFGWIFKKHEV